VKGFGMRYSALLLGVACLGFSACKSPDISVTDVAKPLPSASTVQFSSKENQSKFKFTLPSGWTQADPGPMRLAKFLVPVPSGAPLELSVTTLGGSVGGLLANVNRWQGQLGLPPLTQAQLTQKVSQIRAGSRPYQLVDLLNPSTHQRVLAVITQSESDTWFFKLTGEAEAIDAVRGQFDQFLRGVEIH